MLTPETIVTTQKLILYSLGVLTGFCFRSMIRMKPISASRKFDESEDDRVDEGVRQLELISEAKAAMTRDINRMPSIFH